MALVGSRSLYTQEFPECYNIIISSLCNDMDDKNGKPAIKGLADRYLILIFHI